MDFPGRNIRLFVRRAKRRIGGEGLAVPRKAVIQLADKAFVFVQRSPEEYERREVVLGPGSGDLIEIRQGVEKGEDIVVTGPLLLEGAFEKQVS